MRKIAHIALPLLLAFALSGCSTLSGLAGNLIGGEDSKKTEATSVTDRKAPLDQYAASMLSTIKDCLSMGKAVEADFLAKDLEAAKLPDAQAKELAGLKEQIQKAYTPEAESSLYNSDLLTSAKDYTGKYGYIDQSGKFVIPARFTSVEEFSEGLALVQENKGEPRYFIDRTGAKTLEVKPSIEYYFYDQEKKTVWMVRDGKDSLEAYDGSFEIPLSKVSIEVQGGFHNGLARCDLRTYKVEMKGAYTIPRQGTIYIDRTGRERIFLPTSMPFFSEYDNQCRDFSEGRALVLRIKGNERLFGYIDTTGKWAVEPAFNYAGSFSEGMAAVMYPNTDRWGFVDARGAVALKPFYQAKSVGGFNDGVLLAADGVAGKFFLMRKDGTRALELNAVEKDEKDMDFAKVICGRSGDGIVLAGWRKGALGPGLVESFIGFDQSGRELFALSTRGGQKLLVQDVHGFSNGRAFVKTIDDGYNEYWAVIDTYGAWVVPPTREWTPEADFHNGLAKVKMVTGGGFAYMDRAGKIVYKE